MQDHRCKSQSPISPFQLHSPHPVCCAFATLPTGQSLHCMRVLWLSVYVVPRQAAQRGVWPPTTAEKPGRHRQDALEASGALLARHARTMLLLSLMGPPAATLVALTEVQRSSIVPLGYRLKEPSAQSGGATRNVGLRG